MLRGYNVLIMTTITTNLVRDGNSMAVRLSKTVLAMSGLSGEVLLEVEQGQIVMRAAQSHRVRKLRKPREGWEEQIKRVLAEDPHALDRRDEELDDRDVTAADGLDKER